MTDNDKDEKFYIALRNAQPLAFLASISIAIAAFIHSTTQPIGQTFDYAIIAGSMFLFSFIASLVYQVIRINEEFTQYVRWSQYFFLALGIVYLLLILLNFSQSIPQIIELVLGWVFLVGGISYVIPLRRRWNRIKNKKGQFIHVGFIIAILFIMSALFLINAFDPQIFPKAIINH